MIYRLMVVLMCGLGSLPALAVETPSIVGKWQYDGFFFENARYLNPNPDLTLTFEFRPDGVDRLFWSRKNEPGICERLASYEVVQNRLKQTVTWVNPKNDPSCGSDPDMKLGAETDTEILFTNGELWFHFNLDGKPFEYILIPMPAAGNTPESGPQ